MVYVFIERLCLDYARPPLMVVTDWNNIEQLLVAKFGRDDSHHNDIDSVVRICYDLDKSYSFVGVAVPVFTKILSNRLTSHNEDCKGRTAILSDSIQRLKRVYEANYRLR